MSIKVSFEGGKELAEALGGLKQSLQKPTMRRAAIKSLKPFVDKVRQYAPVSAEDGGALRDSYVAGGPSKLTPKEKRRAKRLRDSDIEVYAGTSNPAGNLQEFGTVNQSAQPHARPAWAATKDQVLKNFTTELATEIERTRVRVAKKAANAAGGE